MNDPSAPATSLACPRVAWVRRGTIARLLATAGGAAAVLLSAWLATEILGNPRPPWDAALAMASALCVFTGLGSALVAGILRLLTTTVRATVDLGEVLAIVPARGRARRVPRSALTEGVVVPDGAAAGRAVLRLDNGDQLSLGFDRIEDAAGLLEAVGLDVGHRRLEISLGSRRRRAAGALVAWLGCTSLAASAIAAVLGPDVPDALRTGLALSLGTAATWGLLAIFRPPRLDIGRDGLTVRVSLWCYFVPFADLARVGDGGDDDSTVVLYYRDGRVRRLYASVPPDVRKAAVFRLEQALQRYHAGAGRGAPALAQLESGGRSLAEWRAALAALWRASTGYREQHVTREAAASVLEDPDAPAERRLGAALALAADDAGAARERVRVVAETCANEPLRVALGRVADGTLDETAVDAVRRSAHDRRRP